MLQSGVEFRIPESRLPGLNGSICTIPSNVLSLSKVQYIDWWLTTVITSSLLPCCLFCKLGKLKTHFSWALSARISQVTIFGNQKKQTLVEYCCCSFLIKRGGGKQLYTQDPSFFSWTWCLELEVKCYLPTLKERPRKFWDAGPNVSEAWASVIRHLPLEHLLRSSCVRGNKSTSHF